MGMLKLPTLSYHWWRGDLIEVYKMLHGFYDKETASFIKLWTEVVERQAGRGHSLRVYLQRSSKPIRQHAFGIRIVTAWNNLPDEIANAPSINTFKNRLDRHWMDQDILYDYKATLDTSVTRKSSVISILSSNPVDINYNTELEAPGSISSPKESTDTNKERSTRCLTDFLNVRGSAAPNSVTTRVEASTDVMDSASSRNNHQAAMYEYTITESPA